MAKNHCLHACLAMGILLLTIVAAKANSCTMGTRSCADDAEVAEMEVSMLQRRKGGDEMDMNAALTQRREEILREIEEIDEDLLAAEEGQQQTNLGDEVDSSKEGEPCTNCCVRRRRNGDCEFDRRRRDGPEYPRAGVVDERRRRYEEPPRRRYSDQRRRYEDPRRRRYEPPRRRRRYADDRRRYQHGQHVDGYINTKGDNQVVNDKGAVVTKTSAVDERACARKCDQKYTCKSFVYCDNDGGEKCTLMFSVDGRGPSHYEAGCATYSKGR